MASIAVVVPDLGEVVEAVRVVRWLKRVGDRVELDEALVELTTDKTDVVLPSPAAGVVEEIHVEEGAKAPVGTVLATLTG